MLVSSNALFGTDIHRSGKKLCTPKFWFLDKYSPSSVIVLSYEVTHC